MSHIREGTVQCLCRKKDICSYNVLIKTSKTILSSNTQCGLEDNISHLTRQKICLLAIALARYPRRSRDPLRTGLSGPSGVSLMRGHRGVAVAGKRRGSLQLCTSPIMCTFHQGCWISWTTRGSQTISPQSSSSENADVNNINADNCKIDVKREWSVLVWIYVCILLEHTLLRLVIWGSCMFRTCHVPLGRWGQQVQH